ncbi:MAG: CvpA family protein [Flavobacteriaceae bacterium]
MEIIDIVLLVLLVYGLYKGFKNGFFVEVASLLALVIGVYGASHFSYFASDWLKTKVEWDEKYINVAAFAMTFIVILGLVSLIGKIITKIVDAAQLGILNKLAGGVFGVAKIALILSVLINIFGRMNDTIPFVKKETLDKTIIYNKVKDFGPTIIPHLEETIQEFRKNNPFIKKTDSISTETSKSK